MQIVRVWKGGGKGEERLECTLCYMSVLAMEKRVSCVFGKWKTFIADF